MAETRIAVVPLSHRLSQRRPETSTGAHATVPGSAHDTRSGSSSARQLSTSSAATSVRRASASPSSPVPVSAEASAPSAAARTRPCSSSSAWSAGGEAAAPGARVECPDEALAGPVDLGQRPRRRRAALLAAEALHVTLELAEARERDPAAEPRGGRFLQAVRLVEDDRVVLRQDSGAVGARAECKVCEVEGVVRDDELRLPRPLARLLGEAASYEGAEAARAALGSHGELGPERLRRLEVELSAVARLRHGDPVPEPLEVGRVLCRSEEPAELVDALEALAAEVVLAALDDGDPDRPPERRRGGRHVFRQELLLQCLRRRRYDDALAGKERRDEVGEALAGARARFRHEVVAALERVGDLGRERLLLGPRLEAGERARQPASRSEEGIHGGRRA